MICGGLPSYSYIFLFVCVDVPADGYSVELGQREPPQRRGVILATGQMIRFSFCILAGSDHANIFINPEPSMSVMSSADLFV